MGTKRDKSFQVLSNLDALLEGKINSDTFLERIENSRKENHISKSFGASLVPKTLPYFCSVCGGVKRLRPSELLKKRTHTCGGKCKAFTQRRSCAGCGSFNKRVRRRLGRVEQTGEYCYQCQKEAAYNRKEIENKMQEAKLFLAEFYYVTSKTF